MNTNNLIEVSISALRTFRSLARRELAPAARGDGPAGRVSERHLVDTSLNNKEEI